LQSCLERIINLDTNIKSDEFREIGKLNEEAFVRNRKLSFVDLNWLILNKKGMTNAMELYTYYRLKNMENISSQAFSKARMNLDPEIFKVLNEEYIHQIYLNIEYETFKGFKILAIDGCVQQLWNEPHLKEYFGEITNKNGDIVNIRTSTSGIYDCLNNIMINFQISPYNQSEKNLAIENIEKALEFFKDQKIIIIFDRGYPSIELFHYLMQRNVKFIFRIKNIAYKEEKELMLTNDECIDIKITKGRLNHIKDKKLKEELLKIEKIRLRISKIKLENEEEEHLISNLYKDDFTYDDLKELYGERWEIEKSFDVLKNKLQIENISGLSKTGIEQDFYAQILVHNIIQDIKNEANKKITNQKKPSISIQSQYKHINRYL
jgi:hypothetical protein